MNTIPRSEAKRKLDVTRICAVGDFIAFDKSQRDDVGAFVCGLGSTEEAALDDANQIGDTLGIQRGSLNCTAYRIVAG
jgi:hypothetical protein